MPPANLRHSAHGLQLIPTFQITPCETWVKSSNLVAPGTLPQPDSHAHTGLFSQFIFLTKILAQIILIIIMIIILIKEFRWNLI